MKSKDQLLLEEAYELVDVRRYLISEGYSAEEIERALTEGWGKDLYNKAKKGLAKAGIAAAMGTAALGGMGTASAGEVTASDMANAIKSGGAASVGYASKDLRNKATTNQSAITYEDMVKAGNVFNMTSEESWKEVDNILDEVYAKAEKDSTSGERKAVDNLKQIESKLDATNNNKLNAENVLKDIYNKTGEATNNITSSGGSINQQKLFKYVLGEIQSGEKYGKGTVGDFLRTYITQHTPPTYKDGKLQGNNFWSADKALRGN